MSKFNIKILAHRGFWKEETEKNTKIAFERAFNSGFGIETDLRDIKGEIVISHNMPQGGEMKFENLLKLLDGRDLTLALNIKADGMADEIKRLLEKYRVSNYFTFDMSIPEMVYQHKTGLKFFTGQSDIIPEPIMFDKAEGIWLDSFNSDWFGEKEIKNILNQDKEVCIVSPDLNQALELFGYKISRYDHLVTFDGLPTKKKLEMLTIEKGLPKGLHKFINHMKQIYTMEHVYMKCKPLFCHQYALSKLKNEGYGLALASNSVRVTIDMMMEKADLQKYLDFTLSNQDVTMPKPNPEIYQTAIKRFGLEPQECLVVEDNLNGINAALSSGAHLLKVETVNDVTYQNIKNRIKEIETESSNLILGGVR